MSDVAIQHVSDTALWVAYYRAKESERFDAIFKDPYAKILIGDRGQQIAESMSATGMYSEWSVIIRTYLIDHWIEELSSQVDTVINLGAGMDTRPYRLNLPKTLRWIEVDYPHSVSYKENLLPTEKANVQLERIPMDLADREKRQELFAELNTQSRKALILTEGVIPYLTEEQVITLAHDLHAQEHFYHWIAEYFSEKIYPYFKTPARVKQMKNAPFRFFPKDWFGLFENQGWTAKEIRYLSEESQKARRMPPAPWWAKILFFFMSKKSAQKHQRYAGYILFQKKS